MTELYFGVSDNFRVKEFHNRRAIDEINMVLSAFDCVLPDHSGIYCSSDITTGRRYYDLLFAYEAQSGEELERKLGHAEHEETVRHLRESNIARGQDFTEAVRERLPGKFVVSPGPFVAADFEQEHYLYLWESVIIQKIHEAWFNEDWEYSNGCTLEYAMCTKKGISRFDKGGGLLDVTCAVAKISCAIEDLQNQGFSVEKLQHHLELVRELSGKPFIADLGSI